MFRKTTFLTVGLALALAAPTTRAGDNWDDYRERLEELRERQRERYEDWLDDQREAREDYRDWLDDQRDRRRGWYGPRFPAGPGHYPAPHYGPAFDPQAPTWRPRYDDYGPVGSSPAARAAAASQSDGDRPDDSPTS